MLVREDFYRGLLRAMNNKVKNYFPELLCSQTLKSQHKRSSGNFPLSQTYLLTTPD